MERGADILGMLSSNARSVPRRRQRFRVALGEELAGFRHELGLECPHLSHRITQFNRGDLGAAERDHLTKPAFVGQSCRVDTQSRAENTVIGTWNCNTLGGGQTEDSGLQ